MKKLTRRQFIKLSGTATATGLLAGCGPTEQPTATPVPTDPPAPTDTPKPTVEIDRLDIVRFYPEVPSKVVYTHHTGVRDSEELVPEALRQMLDASITELTGLNDVREAWAALFAPHERIAIKVNVLRGGVLWTHTPLVLVVTECLQEVGIPTAQIVIFGRSTEELARAGFTINKDGPREHDSHELRSGGS